MRKLAQVFSHNMIRVGWVLLALLLFFAGGYYIVSIETEDAVRVLQLAGFVLLALLILRHPYWGIVMIIASLPMLDILPSIPFGSSVVSLLGGVTLGAFFVPRLLRRGGDIRWGVGLVWGALFIFWIIASHPSAALLPGSDDRTWAFTFVQLWLLAWLAAQLLDTPDKHRHLIWVFSIAVLVSAVYALTQGQIGESLRESERAAGLAGGSNTAARYFVVGMVFLNYLRITTPKPFLRLSLLLGFGILLFATLYTVSRTGLLLLIAAFGLFLVQRQGGRRQIQAFLLLLAAFMLVWFFADNILLIMGTVFTSVREGSDTVGLRYNLWTAGWRMWLDHPLQGVGIGQYVERLASYGSDLLPVHRLRLGAHNMYIQVLSETGLVGIILFVAMFLASLRELWRLGRSGQVATASLAQTWLAVLILMLLGGLTKHDHYDKLIWIAVGLSVGRFGRLARPDEGQ